MSEENFNTSVSEINRPKNVLSEYILSTVMHLLLTLWRSQGLTSIAQNPTVFILLHLSAAIDTFGTPLPKTGSRGATFFWFSYCFVEPMCSLCLVGSSFYSWPQNIEVAQDSAFSFFSLHTTFLHGLTQSSIFKCHPYAKDF